MIVAGINEVSFEPKMPVKMDATGETETPQNMRPVQGPLVNLRYKPTQWRYNVRFSQAPTVGAATLELRANGQVIKTVTINPVGVTQFDGATRVDLSGVSGDATLSVALVVSTAADAGVTAQVDSVVSFEIPLTSNGGC